MKNIFSYLVTFLLFFFLVNILYAQKIDIEKAYQVVLENDNRISQKDVYYSPNPFTPGFEITNLETVKSPNFQSWFFFVDDFPFQSWSHSCYYMFINCETGEFKKIKASFPPKLEGMKIKKLQPMPEKGNLFNFKKQAIKLKSATTYDASNDYAVIISGGIDDEQNWFRYWNDCAAIYSALIDVYNFSRSHIYVIMADGTSSGLDRILSRTPNGQGGYDYTRDSSPLDLDGDGTNDIQYSAKKSNITTVFNTLSGILDEEDHLFVFTTDHGGQSSGNDVYLCLWGENMNDDELATELNKVNAGKISVVMGQCHSGGFVDDLSGTNRIISTACTANENSWAMSNGTYDEYLYHWISAIAGETPEGTTVDADDNNDGWVSIREAFEYAQDNDSYVDGVFIPGAGTVFENPQYNSQPADLGCFVRLSDNWNWNISGPSIVCSNGSFTVNDVPSGATITWEDCSTTLTAPSSSTSNPGVFSKNSNGNGWVEVSINNACGSLDLPRKTVWVGTPDDGHFDGIGIFQSSEDQICFDENQLIVPVYTKGASEPDVLEYDWDMGDLDDYVQQYWDGVIPGYPEIINEGVGVLVTDDYWNSTAVVKVRARNQCPGWSDYYQKTFSVDYCGGGYYMMMSPNPASGDVTLSIETTSPVETTLKSASIKPAFDENEEWEYEVYSIMQSLKAKKTKIRGKSTTLNTQSWKEGVYTVRAKYKDQVLTGKLLVKR